MSEHHTRQGLARHQRDPDPYRPDADPGSHDSTNARDKAQRRPPDLQVICGAPVLCRLCQPGQRCAFHDD